ncbi:hypothetical protein NBT05_14125 [Aquimarina sp. ERC-38]|uniref:antibiotic biosynthesis monooxygenase family protein n=1 Tax=Aquimarina sp. ERC-38 TaxID=2949996 RepID=UPI0022458DD4|nr:hypothetical protein [Aquimarina sp. ERC-38]UZO80079.1 hypothetical protein NBT05_14125 [Aquimarina sp. ERC-38]
MFSTLSNVQRLSSLLLILCFLLISTTKAQEISYTLKKGEVFDLLLVTNQPTGKEVFKNYRAEAFPVAVEKGYSFLSGFKITETLEGDIHPEGAIFGKWKSLADRQEFLKIITTRVPDFHKMRKEIWYYFTVKYYEIEQDLHFNLDPEKVIVATTYWQKEGASSEFENFIAKVKSLIETTGGSLKLAFNKGYSPEGYEYNPDYLILTQWDNKEDFDRFIKDSSTMDSTMLQTLHQFMFGK